MGIIEIATVKLVVAGDGRGPSTLLRRPDQHTEVVSHSLDAH